MLQARDDVGHPLRRLVSVHPGFINRLLAVSVKRNEKHMARGARMLHSRNWLMTRLCAKQSMRLCRTLFCRHTCYCADKDVQGDALLDARASIQVELGFKLFNRLGTNLQDRLVHAERFSCLAMMGMMLWPMF